MNKVSRWWSDVSAHAWRTYFLIRHDSTEGEIEALTGPTKRFFEACDRIYTGLEDGEKDVLRNLYFIRRSVLQTSKDFGETIDTVFQTVHRAERGVAINLGLLSD